MYQLDSRGNATFAAPQQRSEMATVNKTTTNISTIDPDGIPPGMSLRDAELMGRNGVVTFSGKFFAQNFEDVTFQRPIRIVQALRKMLVIQDLLFRNLYVVDRDTNISLGCGMHAVVRIDGGIIEKEEEPASVAALYASNGV